MKITINSTDLSRALAAVSRCIASKSVLPILECFHIKAVGEELHITGSDNENWLTLTVHPTDITYMDDCIDSSFCIESKRFLSVIKELPSQPIGLELSKDHTYITLRWLHGEAKLPISSGAEYPEPANTSVTEESIYLTGTLRNIIDTCSFATANDELRPVMNGIFFDRVGECFTCCATNSHLLVRLRHQELPLPPACFILPSRAANILQSLIAETERQTPKDKEATLSVSVDDRNIIFSHPYGHRLVCRMIEGRYPNYNSVIPGNAPYELTISRTGLITALRRVMVFASPTSLLVKFKLSPDKLTLSASDIDFSTSSEEQLPCSFNGPDGFYIGFKGTQLLDILNHLEGDGIKVQLTDHSRAGVFLPQENKGECEPLMLIMPMMINN